MDLPNPAVLSFFLFSNPTSLPQPGSIIRLDLTNWRPTRDLRTWEAEGEDLLQIKSALDKMALQEARKTGEDLGIHAFPVMERVNPNTGQLCFRTIGSSIRSLQIGLHELRLKDREGGSVGNGL
ncbi:hypothetical protein QTO34_006569 [Cnephaeus nilssonii]|uniref:Uncharacterized protein n=1 Tax=Cnephaeus nilssonii TaxID=3371016 RepID=A0AA40HLY0_CNENI|nr:hypothetical protein QTO34_006569 [Eptesicus nilssonii]